MIEAIVFDAGGVLWKASDMQIYSSFSEFLGTTPENFKRKALKDICKLTIGKINNKEFAGLIEKRFGKKISGRKVHELWLRNYSRLSKPEKGMEMLVKKLSQKYKLAWLSNTIEEHASVDRKKRIWKYFSLHILSIKAGVRKPERKIYKLLLRKLNLKPQKCIFIDNKEANVQTAKQMGFHAIFFRNSKQLKKELRCMGVEF